MTRILRLSAKQFFLLVSAGVVVLSLSFAAYTHYEAPQRYVQFLLKSEEQRFKHQAEIQSSITSEIRSNWLAESKLEQLTQVFTNNNSKPKISENKVQKSPNNDNALLAESSSVEEVKTGNHEKEQMISVDDAFTGAQNDTPLKRSGLAQQMTLKDPLSGFMGFNSLLSLEQESGVTEFTKNTFCSNLGWFAGVSAGLDYYAQKPDFNPLVEKHLEDNHYNLEESKLMVQQVYNRNQFNVAVFGGAQLFNRLDIEGGITYRHFSEDFRSVYENLIRQEFSYIEWVSTGESSGPNGIPIYEPKEIKDYYLISEADTVQTRANNYAVELPLIIRYSFQWNKFRAFASVGSSARVFEYYDVSTTELSTGITSNNRHEQFGLVQLNALIGAGISYEVLPGLELKAEPLFRPSLVNHSEFMLEFNSNSTSFNLGCTYRF